MLHQKLDPHLAKKVLTKTSAVLAGQKNIILQDSFAINKIIRVREMIEHIILPAKGKSFDEYPKVKNLFDVGSRISSHKAVSQTSEESRFNLLIAGALQDTEEDIKKRRPLFEL